MTSRECETGKLHDDFLSSGYLRCAKTLEGYRGGYPHLPRRGTSVIARWNAVWSLDAEIDLEAKAHHHRVTNGFA